jgi:hypothetical protein
MKKKKSKNVKIKTLLASVAFFTAFSCSNPFHRYNPEYNKYKGDGKTSSWGNDRTDDKTVTSHYGGYFIPAWFLWHNAYSSYYYSNYLHTPNAKSYVNDINKFNSTRNFNSGSTLKSLTAVSSATPKATSRGGFGSIGRSMSAKS